LFKTIKAVLKALKVPFEPQSAALPSHVLKSMESGINQYQKEQTISLAQFKNMHFVKMIFEIKFTSEAEETYDVLSAPSRSFVYP